LRAAEGADAERATILFFAPLPDEPDVWPVLELSLALGTNCALPIFRCGRKKPTARGALQNLQAEIVIGKFGVREPAAAARKLRRTGLIGSRAGNRV
jgi:5-formyltetrahydrofolate cyclo-ligase